MKKLDKMSDKEVRKEIRDMIKAKGPNRAFLVSTGESQRYWALKERLGEGFED